MGRTTSSTAATGPSNLAPTACWTGWTASSGHAQGHIQRGLLRPGPFKELIEKPKGVISLGAKMGEGWLLTAEMIELVQGGYPNIVCAQPFGCLPNHIVGKGMVNKIRALYPAANITPIDTTPAPPRSTRRPHQADAGRGQGAAGQQGGPAPLKPLTAEELAGGAPAIGGF